MFKRLKNKKGFSIVEVVIAMVVVSIVTVAAISISSMASDNARKAMYSLDAQYFAADVIEGYKLLDDPAFYPLDAIQFRIDDPTVVPESSGYSVILPKSGYKAYVTIKPDDNFANGVRLYTIIIEVKDTSDNIIASASYTRGGKS